MVTIRVYSWGPWWPSIAHLNTITLDTLKSDLQHVKRTANPAHQNTDSYIQLFKLLWTVISLEIPSQKPISPAKFHWNLLKEEFDKAVTDHKSPHLFLFTKNHNLCSKKCNGAQLNNTTIRNGSCKLRFLIIQMSAYLVKEMKSSYVGPFCGEKLMCNPM